MSLTAVEAICAWQRIFAFIAPRVTESIRIIWPRLKHWGAIVRRGWGLIHGGGRTGL